MISPDPASPSHSSQETTEWDPQLQYLLALKRHEIPPPEFFEDFLEEFQRRQRLEAMRPNVWELWRERLEDFLDHFRVPTTAYAAVGVLAIAATAWIFTSEEMASTPQRGALAEAAPVPTLRMELNSTPSPALPVPVNIPSQRFVGTLPPQYLLHNRPAAESDPFSF